MDFRAYDDIPYMTVDLPNPVHPEPARGPGLDVESLLADYGDELYRLARARRPCRRPPRTPCRKLCSPR